MELTNIPGIGPKIASELNKLDIYNVNDLIRYYPFRYNIYTPNNIRDITNDDTVIINAIVTSNPKVTYFRKLNKLSFTAESDNIPIKVDIFNRNYLSKHLIIGRTITLIGKYNKLKNSFTASDIKLTPILSTKVEPVYHMVSDISKANLTKAITNALSVINEVEDILPNYLNERYEFIDELTAIKEIHNPSGTDNFKKAKTKLKYDELFEFMFKIGILKFKNQIMDNYVIKNVTEQSLNEVLNEIPFELTKDQLNAIKEVYKDFKDDKRMNRLILGDVGSGKTIVAFMAMLLNKKCGYQSAMIAPTEVLARQHYENFNKTFEKLGMKTKLLVGSLTKKEKNEIIESLKNNEIDILFGTHAMLEDNVEFANIGLVITDEQHRFGVNQRKTLQNKGKCVDVLYTTATPIPRTYALTIYGDMDISLIKEKPKGRKDILTKQYKIDEYDVYINEMLEELNNNHQVYIVAPLIEENDETNLNDINKIYELIKSKIGNYTIDILHGKMKQVQKDEVMNKFKDGTTNILISTTVIEVGVDVKNATMMAIFNAERFGLATLHQLRGRVGRNELQSKCLLISDKKTPRLDILCESNDGFYISEKDFELRGSGDLFGIRQSGDMQFKIADISKDYRILLQCKKDAEEFITENIETNFRDYSYYKYILEQLINND